MSDPSLPRRMFSMRLGLIVVAACATATVDAADIASKKGDRAEDAQVLHVGPARTITNVAEAAHIAHSGDTILIDAGDYLGDVATWTQDHLTVRALSNPVRMVANGKAAEAKAIWVIKGTDVLVQGIEFVGARVPDRNGAGIRFEGGKLTVRNCRFLDNEDGMLVWNNPTSELRIENSEFGRNGAGDGQSHNLYVGEIARLTVIGSYFHHARVGHLLKTRAEHNVIMYNRLTDEAGGTASYELEFPSGGVAFVIGNIIEQGPQTQNSSIVSYGAEEHRWPRNELFLVNNTLVDDLREGGTFLKIAPGPVRIVALNNLLIGRGVLDTAAPGQYAGNIVADRREIASGAAYDYRLKMGSPFVGKAKAPGDANGVKLQPDREYIHPAQTRPLGKGPYSPGALQSVAP